MNFFRNRRKRKGFTLIELLIVIGILVLLLAITIIAVNPFEQFNRAGDVTRQAVVKDFASATKYYYTYKQSTPWVKNTACRSELAKKKTLDQMPSCTAELSDGGTIDQQVLAAKESKDVYVTECSNAVAVCYKPKSKEFNTSDVKYAQNGALQAGCPGGSDCYACNFSTNNAAECFQALSPNGSLAAGPTPQPNEVLPIPNRESKNTCADAPQGKASCMSEVVTDLEGNPLSSIAPPAGFGPEQLHTAYNLPCTPGGSVQSICQTPTTYGPKTIAIVVAYHTPTLETDLGAYSDRYGLPPCRINNGCLTIVNQNGATSPVPGNDSLWSLEESMDVQLSHAICQTCKILVVETFTNNFTDLTAGVNRAAAMGASTISNSWGNNEWAGSTAFDSAFDHPGIFVAAASGDWGHGAFYPAGSKNVISVGGTTLSVRGNNTYGSESVWSGTGSGCSLYHSANTFQTALSNWNLTGCGTKRSSTDVSAVADPNTGMAVFDSTPYGDRSGWWILGGTSASSPIVSAALALLGNAPTGVDAGAFVYANPSKFRDVTTGTNGSCGGTIACAAGVGYDGPTGLGSPNFDPPPGSGDIPTITNTPIPTPTITPTPTPISTGSGSLTPAYIINTGNKTYTKVTRYTLTGQTPVVNCDLAETTTCSQIPTSSGGNMVGQCTTATAGYAVFSQVSCPGAPTATPSPSPTPTPVVMNCGLPQTFSLSTSTPILALPGDTVVNTLSIRNNSSAGCGSTLYTISRGAPSGWTVTGVPASVTVAGGATTNVNFTIQVPANATAGNYGYQFWVARPGESSPNNVNGSIQVAQVGPTNTPTPTPINCFQGWTNSLGSTSMSGNAGDTINETLTITYNNPASCGTAQFGISHSYPSGWIINNLPPSVTLTGGQSVTIPFTITISTGAQVQDYMLQYWVNSGGQPMNATVHVLHAASPPEEQMFSNFNVKPYGTYALFEYSYNAQGAVSGRLDVSTDPNGLNTTAAPAPAGTRYGFAFNSGSAMDASNNPSPTAVRGFINSSPQSWSGWQCGATIYYRMYNDGDKRIKSPVRSTVVDCNTVVNVLSWTPWYAAIYQGVYDARYDADNNGVINYVDYWILVRATRLR